MALHLVDEQEEEGDPDDAPRWSAKSAKITGGTAENHGPMYGITSMKAVQRPKRSAYPRALDEDQ